MTRVHCEYFACDYLGGDAENRDVVENRSVAWVRRDEVPRFVSVENIYPPILQLLEDTNDAARRP